jgi:hypothetical protein
MESEPTGVNGSQIGLILDGVNGIDNGPDFLSAQNSGKGLVPFGIDELKGMPVTSQDVDEVELNAAVADSHRGRGPFVGVLSVEEVVLKLLFSDFLGTLSIEIDQLSK